MNGARGDLIGSGWSFPVRLTPGGSVQLFSGSEEIDAAIRMILTTAPGERVMRPDFGCSMWEQVFAPVNPNTLGLIEQSVRDDNSDWGRAFRAALADLRKGLEGDTGRLTAAAAALDRLAGRPDQAAADIPGLAVALATQIDAFRLARSANSRAVCKPARPAPMMTTSNFSIFQIGVRAESSSFCEADCFRDQ